MDGSEVGSGSGERDPARAGLDRVTAWCGAAMRGAVAGAGAVAAVATAAPWVSLSWVAPAVVISVAWSAVFGWVAVWRGLSGPVMAVDVALTVVLCLAQVRLVAPPVLSGGASWVDGLASMTIVIANFAWRPRLAVPAGLAVTVAHFVGARLAGAEDGGLVNIGIHLVQIAATAALMTVLRRAAELADTALATLRETEREAEVARARREDEREHKRRLHNSALATLIFVGTNMIEAGPLLRRRAAADLAVIEREGAPEAADGPIELRQALAAVAGQVGLTVELDLVPCQLPEPVAAAFADATAEALTNIARHAGTGAATIRSIERDSVVHVEIRDTGRGFDPAAVPPHRYGVREAIMGRMRSVGGDAVLTSGPGGTLVGLRWPR